MIAVKNAPAKKRAARPVKYVLCLYVAGETPKSVSALANLKKLCAQHLEGSYRIKVIDLLKNPRLDAITRSRSAHACPSAAADCKNHRRFIQHRTRPRGLDVKPDQ